MREECTTGWSPIGRDADVVAVEGDVDLAERHRRSGQLLDQRPQPPRHEGAAGVDADQRDPLAVRLRLHDLVGDPNERALRRSSRSRTMPQVLTSVPLPGLSGPG